MVDSTCSAEALLAPLIRFPSVSNTSNCEVSHWVAQQLVDLGFDIERVGYRDEAGVEKMNIVARRGPATSGGLAYFAHTDVVPADGWMGPNADVRGIDGQGTDGGESTPGPAFDAIDRDHRIFGRGSCDMKGSLACMLAAASRCNAAEQTSPLTIICTADEEIGFGGARKVVERSRGFRQLVAEQPVGIIGEPTSMRVVHAHKGIAGFTFTSHGRAAHSSSREGVNANLAMVPLLVELKRLYEQSESDQTLQHAGFDPPTLTWNFGVSDRANALNVTPAISRAWVFFRPMPGIDGASLVEPLLRCAESLNLSVKPLAGGEPLWVDPGSACIRQMCQLANCVEPKTVCYGTDGGQYTELQQLLVLGPGDIAQAHTADEWISKDQLRLGTDIYESAIRHRCY